MKLGQKNKVYWAIIFLVVFLTSSIISILPTPKVSAQVQPDALTYIDQDLLSKVKQRQNYYWLRNCFNHQNIDKITKSEMDSWEWFVGADHKNGGPANAGYEGHMIIGGLYGPKDDSVWGCRNGENVERAWGYLGYDNPRVAFCVFSWSKFGEGGGDPDDGYSVCKDGVGADDDHYWDMNDPDDFSTIRKDFEKIIKEGSKSDRANVTDTIAGIPDIETLPDEMEFVRAYETVIRGCNMDLEERVVPKGQSEDLSYEDDGRRYLIPVVDAEGNEGWQVGIRGIEENMVPLVSTVTRQSPDRSYEFNEWLDDQADGYAKINTCGEIADVARDKMGAYAAWVKANPPTDDEKKNGTGGNNPTDVEPTCDSQGGVLAWFLCGALDVLDGIVSFLDRQINALLYIDSEIYDNQGVKEGWTVMRNIALLILVPMMMFMVIGTALNFGPFDPYTVKKALPRMLVATIFIVLSLPITQFGIALSNTIGQGIGNLIISASPVNIDSISSIFSRGTGTNEAIGWGVLVAGLAGLALGGLGVVLSFALVAAIALLIGFVILVMRQVLLVVLVVLAPLAILVWIFPGNDKLWGIWKATFLAMLLLYPIIAVLLASGKFVAGLFGQQ